MIPPRMTDGPATRQARVAEAARVAAMADDEWDEDLVLLVVVAGRDRSDPGSDGMVLYGFDGPEQAAGLCASAAKSIFAAHGIPSTVDVRPVRRG